MENKIAGLLLSCPRCGADFAICTSCNREHWYCSPECSLASRKETQKRAASAYRKTEKGRETSRKNQRNYRKRKRRREKSVSHHCSPELDLSLDMLPQIIEEDSNDQSCPTPTVPTVRFCLVCKSPIQFFLQISAGRHRKSRKRSVKRCCHPKLRPRSKGFSMLST